MIETCTKLELIQYLYNELDERSSKHLKKELEHDLDLQTVHRGNQKILSLIDKAWLEPRESTVEQILAYSRY